MKYLILAMVLALNGCVIKEDAERQQTPEQLEAAVRAQKKEFVASLIYVKDPRTNMCFAYTAAGVENGLFATVSCEDIPPNMEN